MSLLKGLKYSPWIKQQTHTNIPTKEELVLVYNGMSIISWSNYFLEVKVYTVQDNITYQYNGGMMILKNNGKTPSKNKPSTSKSTISP